MQVCLFLVEEVLGQTLLFGILAKVKQKDRQNKALPFGQNHQYSFRSIVLAT